MSCLREARSVVAAAERHDCWHGDGCDDEAGAADLIQLPVNRKPETRKRTLVTREKRRGMFYSCRRMLHPQLQQQILSPGIP